MSGDGPAVAPGAEEAATTAVEGAVLSVRDLRVELPTDDGVVKAADGLSFDLLPGETLGVVGESGSGKSVMSMAILGLLPKHARVSGEIRFRGENLLGRSEKELRPVRGRGIAMVFQDALTALNPVFRVGDQIAEAIAVHTKVPGKVRHESVVRLLDLVGIPDPELRARQYPHELSGGMRQRAMIAMAVANDPDVLIADEPTTALDVTIQAQVLDVIRRVQERTHSAVLLITHDLGVVAGTADRVLVMYAGRAVEQGSVDDIFYRPSHPYTSGLLAALPRLDRRSGAARLHRIEGQPPSPIDVPTGCAFHPRCPLADEALCSLARPRPVAVGEGHRSWCHFAGADQEEAR